MRYQVEIQGETLEVDVRDGPAGMEVAVGDGPHRPARLRPGPEPYYTLEVGSSRKRLLVGPDVMNPGSHAVRLEGKRTVSVSAVDARSLAAGKRGGAAGGAMKLLRSAMPGIILEVRVAPGDAVKQGQVLLILEAMKMQNEIAASADAVVKAVHVEAGSTVAGGDPLVEFGEG